MLYGRAVELAAIEELTGAARNGTGGALVLRGEAGAGKSALLEHAAARAAGRGPTGPGAAGEGPASAEGLVAAEGSASVEGPMRVLRATGAEPESGLAFAALHQLLLPVTDRLDALPGPQREAVEGALGLAAPVGEDARFLVAAGVLSLLAEAAEAESGGGSGVLCLIDDFQWFDRASADAVLFAVRRLATERVAVLIAVRDGGDRPVRDVPELRVGGLDAAGAAELLAACAPDAVPAAPVRARLLAATGGNPLALRELAATLTPGQLAGREPLPEPLPAGAGATELYGRRIAGLDASARRVLLVAAADGSGELDLVLRAAAPPAEGGPDGVPGRAAEAGLESAENAGLVVVEGGGLTVRFRHPLIRSAAYAAATFAQRRAAHLALAGALDGKEDSADADRRVWHRAAAVAGRDAEVAELLADVAERARARGGYADAALALARSAELTPARPVRARRLTDAATAAWLGGLPGRAESLLAEARELTGGDPVPRAELDQLRGRFELGSGDASEAQRVFTEGAERAREAAPGRALRMLADAAEAAACGGDVAAAVRIGEAAEALTGLDPDPSGEEAFLRDLLVGTGAAVAGDTGRGERLLRGALTRTAGLDRADLLLWASAAAGQLGDMEAVVSYVVRAGQVARVSGMTGQLPVVLEYVARAERLSGRFALSAALTEEGLALAREAGYVNSTAAHLANLAVIAAVEGREDDCARQARESLALAVPHRVGLTVSVASYGLGMLDLGLGRFAAAHTRFEALTAAGPGAGHPVTVRRSAPDRVEAAVGCGERDAARAALETYEQWTGPARTPQAEALLARCRALLAEDGDEAVALYEEAEERHAADGGSPFEEARTALLHGERLRRTHRGGEARRPLRTALETFRQLGAEPWTRRAHGELRAAGESAAGRPGSGALAALTPQELRIARLVADGASNKDVAARLFLSPRTVEYHLYKAYPKLGVSSRTELARAVAG